MIAAAVPYRDESALTAVGAVCIHDAAAELEGAVRSGARAARAAASTGTTADAWRAGSCIEACRLWAAAAARPRPYTRATPQGFGLGRATSAGLARVARAAGRWLARWPAPRPRRARYALKFPEGLDDTKVGRVRWHPRATGLALAALGWAGAGLAATVGTATCNPHTPSTDLHVVNHGIHPSIRRFNLFTTRPTYPPS